MPGLNDKLTPWELGHRNLLIENGIKSCKILLENLLKEQKFNVNISLCRGSLEGFEECKQIDELHTYETMLQELYNEETKEIELYLSNKKEDVNPEKIEQVWEIKGKRAQIEFVYKHIKALRVLYN